MICVVFCLAVNIKAISAAMNASQSATAPEAAAGRRVEGLGLGDIPGVCLSSDKFKEIFEDAKSTHELKVRLNKGESLVKSRLLYMGNTWVCCNPCLHAQSASPALARGHLASLH